MFGRDYERNLEKNKVNNKNKLDKSYTIKGLVKDWSLVDCRNEERRGFTWIKKSLHDKAGLAICPYHYELLKKGRTHTRDYLLVNLPLYNTWSLVIVVLEHCHFPNKGLKPQLLPDNLLTTKFITGAWNLLPCPKNNHLNKPPKKTVYSYKGDKQWEFE